MLQLCYHMPDEISVASNFERTRSTNARLDDREAMQPAVKGMPDLCPFHHESTRNARFDDSTPPLSALNACCD
jgi:hypothetical protein